jgi:dTDP-L-rhamnose 4-epimerase
VTAVRGIESTTTSSDFSPSKLSVLITGGAGFIGCGLSTRLLQAGAQVTVVDILHPQVHVQRIRPVRLHPEVRFIPVDVTHAKSWDALLCMEKPDAVVHLAAETGTAQSLREATLHGSANVIGTTQMLDAFSRTGHIPEHIVLSSSRAVYGEGLWRSSTGTDYAPAIRHRLALAAGQWDPPAPDGNSGTPLPSRAGVTTPQPTNIYAATKLAQEHLCLAWGAALGASVTVLRLQNVYGPGQSILNSYTGVLTAFARRATAGKAINVYEDGQIIRDFVHIDDVLDTFQAALQKTPLVSRIVDVGSGRPQKLLDVAFDMAALSGSPAPVVSGQYRLGDVRAAFCDIDDARRQLNYTPRRELREGLRGLLDWVAQSEE